MAEIIQTRPCECCRDLIPDAASARVDTHLGTVCRECHMRLRGAAAWLKQSANLTECRYSANSKRNHP